MPTSLLHLYSELDPSYHLLALCLMQLMNDSDRADNENKEAHLTHVFLRWKSELGKSRSGLWRLSLMLHHTTHLTHFTFRKYNCFEHCTVCSKPQCS